MPFLIKCGGCQAKMNAPDAAAGKKVKCPKCGGIIPVPAAPPSPSQVAAGPAPKPKKAPPPVEDDEEEEEPQPKKKKSIQKAPAGDGDGEEFLAQMPDEEAEQIRQTLSGKERILWAGKASVKLMVMRSLPIALFGGLFLIVAVVTFFVMRGGAAGMGHDAGAIGLLLPLGFVVFAIGMGTAPFWAKARAGRTFYALTNRRALCWKGGVFWGASFEEFTAMQMVNYKRQNSWFVKGAGDLVFKEEVQITTTHHSGGYRGGRRYGGGTSQSVRIIQHGFLAIPNVQEVEYLIKSKIVEKFNRVLDEE